MQGAIQVLCFIFLSSHRNSWLTGKWNYRKADIEGKKCMAIHEQSKKHTLIFDWVCSIVQLYNSTPRVASVVR